MNVMPQNLRTKYDILLEANVIEFIFLRQNPVNKNQQKCNKYLWKNFDTFNVTNQ
jgi:hypothetical protein